MALNDIIFKIHAMELAWGALAEQHEKVRSVYIASEIHKIREMVEHEMQLLVNELEAHRINAQLKQENNSDSTDPLQDRYHIYHEGAANAFSLAMQIVKGAKQI